MGESLMLLYWPINELKVTLKRRSSVHQVYFEGERGGREKNSKRKSQWGTCLKTKQVSGVKFSYMVDCHQPLQL